MPSLDKATMEVVHDSFLQVITVKLLKDILSGGEAEGEAILMLKFLFPNSGWHDNDAVGAL